MVALAPMVVPVHDIPGRLRFRLALLRRDRRNAAAVRAHMRAIEGVRSASANPLTGSLVVHYDGAAATRQKIAAGLAKLAINAPAAPPAPANANRWAEFFANAIAERIVEHAVRVAVAAVI